MFEFRAAIVCLRITEYFSSVRLRDWQVRGGALVDLVLLVLEKKTNTMSATQLAFWWSCKRTNKPVCSMTEGSVRAWHWHGLAWLGLACPCPCVYSMFTGSGSVGYLVPALCYQVGLVLALVRPGLVWLSFALLGFAWLGLAWLGLAWLGLAWLGLAWPGLAWLGLAWLGWAWLFLPLLCVAVLGLVWPDFMWELRVTLGGHCELWALWTLKAGGRWCWCW